MSLRVSNYNRGRRNFLSGLSNLNSKPNIFGTLNSYDKYEKMLSSEYKTNRKKLNEMKYEFFATHGLPEDNREINPYGTDGLLRSMPTKAQKQRAEQWKQIEAEYYATHPISEADKKVLEARRKNFLKISALC